MAYITTNNQNGDSKSLITVASCQLQLSNSGHHAILGHLRKELESRTKSAFDFHAWAIIFSVIRILFERLW